MKFALIALLAACTGQIVTPQAPVEPAPQVTVRKAANATFRINVQELDGDEWSTVSSGTAWIALNGDGKSFLMTAAHVCDASDEMRYTLTSQGGIEHTGVKVERVSSYYDLCLVSVGSVIGPALNLSGVDPYYDQPVSMVGAPLGVFGCGNALTDESEACGIAVISRGFYAGGNIVAMPAVNGFSGSPVFTENGVVGVLVARWPRFTNMGIIEPLDHLRTFLLLD